MLDKNHSSLPIVDGRCSVEVGHIRGIFDNTTITARCYTEFPLASRLFVSAFVIWYFIVPL